MKKIMELRKRLQEIKTVKELIQKIPQRILSVSALVLIMFLLVLPITTPLKFGNGEFYELNEYRWIVDIGNIGVGACLIACITIAKSFYERKDRNQSWKSFGWDKGLLICLGVMFIWSCISCLFSTNKGLSFFGDVYRREGLLTYIVYVGMVALAVNMKTESGIKIVLEGFVLVSTFIAGILFLDNATLLQFFKMGRNRGPFFQMNHYGYYLCMTIVAAVVLLLMDQERKKKQVVWYVIRMVQIILIANAVVLCTSLGPLVSISVALMALTILIGVFHSSYLPRILIADLVIACIILGVNTSNWNLSREFQVLQSDIKTLATMKNIESVGTGRGVLWKYGVKFALERPIFGYGPDNLGYLYEQLNVGTDRPHNELIQFAASLGIPAMVCYLSGLLIHLVQFIKKIGNCSVLTIGVFAIVGAYLVSSLFGNTMFYTSPYFFVMLGLSYRLLRVESE